ncbi:MAG: DegT/DnrJ/EryC1/StrS family aminotransferase, partial [Ignavibacteriaceae bacterium]|nr:DegT/DnrJ/EryC1/StrS family aminotransferase [Ignavibacteriaceae bacterium]
WTTGPKAIKFENEFKNFIGSKYAVSANSWTAAAHLSLEAIGIKADDEVIIPTITFTATAEIICYFNAKPVLVDIQPDTLNIDPEKIEQAITDKTKAIIPVHYGGQPCDMDEIMAIAKKYNLKVIEDAAHSLPASYKNKIIGTIGDVTCFSFYATKTLATGEGGMICTQDEEIAERCSIMRLHGISKDAWKRYSAEGSWYYEVIAPGYKYNFTDIQAALGLSQLKKIQEMLQLRENIFQHYTLGFKDEELISVPKINKDRKSAHHLYSLQIDFTKLKINRSQFIDKLKDAGIGASVHFIPIYRHPFYKDNFNLKLDDYPMSEKVYPSLVSLPIWPGISELQLEHVINSVKNILMEYK